MRTGNMMYHNSVNKLGAAALVLLMGLAALSVLAVNASSDPYENSTFLGSLSEPRSSASVAVGNDGNLYVIGGFETTAFDSAQSTVLIFNMTTKQTTLGASMTTGVVVAPVVKTANGTMYVLGGWNYTLGTALATTQIYNPLTNSWSSGTAMPKGIWGAAAVLGPDARIYVFGGRENSGAMGNSTLIYNPVSNSWSYGKDLLNPRVGASAVVEGPASIMLAGGATGGGAVNLVEHYNPVSDSWSYGVNLTLPRSYGGLASARNGHAYFLSGATTMFVNPASGQIRSDTERLDRSSGTAWESIWGYHMSSFGFDVDPYGRAYIVGGWDGTSLRTDVYMWVFGEIENPYQIMITSPGDGTVVSDLVTVTAEIVNWMGSSPWSAFMGVDFLVDGVLYETQTSGWGGIFVWNATALPDGSTHVLTVRGYHWDGKIVEDSVTVTVSSESVTDRIVALEDEIASVQNQIAALQAQLARQDGNVTQIAAQLATLGTSLANLQAQLDALKEQNDKLETKANTAGTYGMVNIVLVVIVLAMLALMFAMSRRKP